MEPDRQPYVTQLAPDIQAIVRKHALFPGQSKPWWLVLFDLRRELEPTAGEARSEDDWKAVVDCWRVVSVENGAEPPDSDSAWSKFKGRLAVNVKQAFGAALARVRESIPTVILPSQLVNDDLKPIARVMLAISDEAKRREEVTFYASYRLIGSLAGGIDPMTVMRRLGALSKAGFLSLIEPGIPGTGPRRKANAYMWHDPARPGETVWNSSKARHANKTSAPQDTDEIPF